MKKINFLEVSIVSVVMFTIISCNKKADKNFSISNDSKTVTEKMMLENGSNPDEIAVAENSDSISGNLSSAVKPGKNNGHYLFTESNAAAKNEIVAFEINANGTLKQAGSTMSGGNGTGKGLGSQGALVLDENHEWLFAVNAGSNSISSFRVHSDGSLTLAYTAITTGTIPVSVSVHNNLLYVLNRGSDNIDGYMIGGNGVLTHIPGSTKSLSGTNVDAPQISFTPGGSWIVVTEKATNIIGTFKVNDNGSVNNGIFTPSIGPTPFGFDFSRGRYMIVSNAAGGAPGAGSSTSYIVSGSGIVNDVNGAIPDYQAAPCWFAVTKFGRYAYTTNTGTNNISSYYISERGGLYLIEGEAAKTGMAPIDIVVAANNFYVYELNGKSATIGEYRRKHFGGLKYIDRETNVPAAATGLATF